MDPEQLFNLCAAMAAGASGLKEMPKIAGAQQLLSALGRLAGMAAAQGEDAFLERVAQEIESRLTGGASEDFYAFIDRLALQFASEAKKRCRPPQ